MGLERKTHVWENLEHFRWSSKIEGKKGKDLQKAVKKWAYIFPRSLS